MRAQRIISNLARRFRRLIRACAILTVKRVKRNIHVRHANYHGNVTFSAEGLCRPTGQITDRSRIVLRPRLNHVLSLYEHPPRRLANHDDDRHADRASLSLTSCLNPKGKYVHASRVARRPNYHRHARSAKIARITKLFRVMGRDQRSATQATNQNHRSLTSTDILLKGNRDVHVSRPATFSATTMAFNASRVIKYLAPSSRATKRSTFNFRTVASYLLRRFPCFNRVIPCLQAFTLFSVFPMKVTNFFAPNLCVLSDVRFMGLTLHRLIMNFIYRHPSPSAMGHPIVRFLSTFIGQLRRSTIQVGERRRLQFPDSVNLNRQTRRFRGYHVHRITFTYDHRTPVRHGVGACNSPVTFRRRPNDARQPRYITAKQPIASPMCLLSQFRYFRVCRLSFMVCSL